MSRLSSLGAAATLLDPAEVAAPLLQQPLHFMQDQAAAPQWMLDTHQHILRSDGFMVLYMIQDILYRVFSKGRNAVGPSKSLIFWTFSDILDIF